MAVPPKHTIINIRSTPITLHTITDTGTHPSNSTHNKQCHSTCMSLIDHKQFHCLRVMTIECLGSHRGHHHSILWNDMDLILNKKP